MCKNSGIQVALMAAGILLLAFVTSAVHAGTKTIASNCEGCLTIGELEDQAWTAAAAEMVNTTDEIVILVASDTHPVSGYFRIEWGSDYVDGYGWYNFPYMVTVTVDLDSAIALDNALFARASGVPPIAIPSGIAGSANGVAAPELLIAHVQDTLIPFGLPQIGWWRSIVNTAWTSYMRFTDTRTNQTREVYFGDTITVRFQDNSTVQLRFVGFNTALAWEVVTGSERNSNGDPITPENPLISVTPIAPGGTIPVFGPNGSTVSFAPIQFCQTEFYSCTSSLDEGNQGTTVFLICTTRRYSAPC